MIITYDRACKKYKVRTFVDVHNHELETPDTIHMIRSHRHVSEAHGCAISVATDAGLTPSEAHGLLVIKARGRQNLGYVLEDHKPYLRTRRQKYMKYGDLECILRYFKEKSQWPT